MSQLALYVPLEYRSVLSVYGHYKYVTLSVPALHGLKPPNAEIPIHLTLKL